MVQRTLLDIRRGAVVGVLLVAACLAGCAQQDLDRYGARTPVLAFPATTCPSALGRTADVTRSQKPTDSLIGIDPRPNAALICSYRGPFGSTPSRTREIASHLELGAPAARALAAAAAQVSAARPPQGSTSCPADFGTTTVLTFTYSHAAPTSLWWNTSGCQTLDNGRLQASLLANPSFTHFQTTFTRITHSHA